MRQEAGAGAEKVLIGLFEIAGVPRVGHLAVFAGVLHGEVDLAVPVRAEEAGEPPQIFPVHGDDHIRRRVVRRHDEPRRPGREGDALLAELPLRRRIHIMADLLRGGCRGGNRKLRRQPGPVHEILHDEFRHGRPADIAVADEKNAFHKWLLSERLSSRGR